MSKPVRFILGVVSSSAAWLAASTAIAADGHEVPTSDGSWVRAVGLGASSSVAIALSILGASYAVGRIGSAALGAAAEKPELLTRSLLFVALAEGLAILGFAIAMVLAQKI